METAYMDVQLRVERLDPEAIGLHEAHVELMHYKQQLQDILKVSSRRLALTGARTLMEILVHRVMEREHLIPHRDLMYNIAILGAPGEVPQAAAVAWAHRREHAPLEETPLPIIPKELYSDLHNVRVWGNFAIHPWDPGMGTFRAEPSETTVEAVLHHLLSFLEWYFAHYYHLETIYRPVTPAPPPLPPSPGELVGRERDLRTVRDLLASNRLVTLLGSGGIGKTALARQLLRVMVDVYRTNVAYISLEHIDSQLLLQDPEYLVGVIATAVGVHAEHKTLHTLTEHLNRGAFLLVLDNCEHLVDQCARLIKALFDATPELRILATSRRPLGLLDVEQCWRVPALSVPDPAHVPAVWEHRVPFLRQFASVNLFEMRARKVRPDFEITPQNGHEVARICATLEGIPLALELAASKVEVLPIALIAQGLEDCLGLLAYPDPTRPERARTVRAAIAWSYNLLRTHKERRLLARLSVFRGWTVEAMQAVCAGQGLEASEMQDVLAGLIRDALVIFDTYDDAPRYRQLETIRQFSREQLTRFGELDSLRQRHLAYYGRMAQRAEPELMLGGATAWLRTLAQEHDNLKSALDFAVKNPQSCDESLRLTVALQRFWALGGYLHEGRAYYKAVLAREDLAVPLAHSTRLSTLGSFLWKNARRTPQEDLAVLLAKALYGAGLLAWYQTDAREAGTYFERSLAMFRATREDTRREEADVWNYLGNIATDSGDYKRARRYHKQSLNIRRQLHDRAGIAASLHNLGEVAWCKEEWATARSLVEQALGYLDDAHANQVWKANCYELLGTLALQRGDDQTALSYHEQALRSRTGRDDRVFISYSLEGYAAIAAARQQAERAARLLGAAASLRNLFGVPLPVSWHKYFKTLVERVRSQLSAPAFDAAWATGYDWTYEQMIQYALDDRWPCVSLEAKEGGEGRPRYIGDDMRCRSVPSRSE